jgi:phosphoribosylformimino-5-aminoimidazole carboxamide ribotide isomerase
MLAQKHTFTVIPAVDLLGNEAVRLEQGEFDRVVERRADPVALVERFVEAGARLIHVVDLDGAGSGRLRPEVVRTLAEAASPAAVQASGGVRSTADALSLLDAGAERVVVGTAAFSTPDALAGYVDTLADRLVVAIDVRDRRVVARGWRKDAGIAPDEAAERCAEAGVPRILCTAIERDGTLAGPDLELLSRVLERSGLPVLAAGGIGSVADLSAVEETGCEGAVVGRAFLSGEVPLSVLAARGSAL